MTARLMRSRSARRRFVLALAAAVMLGGGGCYEVAFFYPSPALEGAPGAVQGSPVVSGLGTDGRRLGVASRLTGKEADETGGQAYIVLSVGEAYTASAEGGGLSTIIRVVASVVNDTKKPIRFEVQDTRLDCAGRRFGPRWTYRSPEVEEVEKERFRTVAAGSDTGGVAARYDLYFDLGTYDPPSLAYRRQHAKPRIQGVPLHTVREMTVTWKGEWGGEKRSGEARFARNWSGGYPVPGPYWGGGWYLWANPWPVGPLGYGYIGPRIAFWPWRWRGKVKLLKK